jgi:hypothetical protein
VTHVRPQRCEKRSAAAVESRKDQHKKPVAFIVLPSSGCVELEGAARRRCAAPSQGFRPFAEPSVGSAIEREIHAADRIDLLCALGSLHLGHAQSVEELLQQDSPDGVGGRLVGNICGSSRRNAAGGRSTSYALAAM